MKNKINIFLIAFLLVITYACKKDEGYTVDITKLVINFENAIEDIIFTGEESIFTTRAIITNFAPQNLTYTVEVDASSTGIEGTEFNIVSKTVTIVPGYISGNVEIEILGDGLAEGVTKTIVLNLVSSDVILGDNLECTIDIRKVVIPDLDVAALAGDWTDSDEGNTITISETATATEGEIFNVWWGMGTMAFEVAETNSQFRWELIVPDEEIVDCCWNSTEWHISDCEAYYDIINNVITLSAEIYGFSGDNMGTTYSVDFTYARD